METKRRIPPQLRKLVWETYMKNPNQTVGPCFVCQGEIHILNFECGHVKSFATGGLTNLDNLRPICGSCNKSMGKKELYAYRDEFYANQKKEDSFGDKLYSLINSFIHLSVKEKSCEHIMIKGKRKDQPCGEKLIEGTTRCRKHQADIKKKK